MENNKKAEAVKKRLETMRKRNSFWRPFGDKNCMKNPEIVEKARLKKIGKKQSPESIKKRSEALKGRTYEELMGKEKADKLKKLRSLMLSGERAPAWLGGVTNERSDENCTPEFREAIRKRDNQICMLCGIHREKLKRTLDVHHIDYNKLNTVPKNCVSLCHSCHQKTNYNRGHWFEMLKNILSERYHYEYPVEFKVIKFQDKEVKYESS